MPSSGLILLDRDGVLNSVVIDPEQGTIDSPLHPGQVQVYPWVPAALARLQEMGFTLAICTNQPSAAKGKTTRSNLESAHEKILEIAQSGGARIASSHICFHRAEDQCACRKPKTGLLEEAIRLQSGMPADSVWMVGDGVTDVQAGKALRLRTAFLGPKKCDSCKIFEGHELKPDFWGKNLEEFVLFMESRITPRACLEER